MNSLLIGAATSNSGKTTFTIGLLRALRDRGLNVQPYKCGPDYIDTMFHHIASDRESVNLDTFMNDEEHVKGAFDYYGTDADIRVAEGVMGLFDGYERCKGSSAEIAMLLDIPVILIVNAKSVAYSVAPLIYGFKNFNPRLRVAGVIFNMVASENHYSFLRSACADAGVECLGYLPRNEKLTIPGRHLGLTISAREETERLISLAAEEIEQHVDIDRLLQLTLDANTQHTPEPQPCINNGKVIAVAKDAAFNFTYRTNIDMLRSKGKMIFFSPLHDDSLPPCDMVYLPGGYPELFAAELQSNASLRVSIKEYAEAGGHIIAECGGFMYLCQDIDGKQMCGVLPIHATMDKAKLHLGYRKTASAICLNDSIGLYATRGHEFHYSDILEETLPTSVTKEQCQLSAKGTAVPTAIYRYKNVVAGYTHWQFLTKSSHTPNHNEP